MLLLIADVISASRRVSNSLDQSSMPSHADRTVTTTIASPTPPPPPSHNHSSLIVNLPPSPPRNYPSEHERTLAKRENLSTSSAGSPVGVTYAETTSPISPGTPHIVGAFPSPGTQGHHECTVCYEKPVDSVLYMCGHMCMCYECALQQWRGRGGGHCPICRASIRDVIRTYRS